MIMRIMAIIITADLGVPGDTHDWERRATNMASGVPDLLYFSTSLLANLFNQTQMCPML